MDTGKWEEMLSGLAARLSVYLRGDPGILQEKNEGLENGAAIVLL